MEQGMACVPVSLISLNDNPFFPLLWLQMFRASQTFSQTFSDFSDFPLSLFFPPTTHVYPSENLSAVPSQYVQNLAVSAPSLLPRWIKLQLFLSLGLLPDHPGLTSSALNALQSTLSQTARVILLNQR